MARVRQSGLAFSLLFALGSLSSSCAFVGPVIHTRGSERFLSVSTSLHSPPFLGCSPHLLRRLGQRPQSSLRCSGLENSVAESQPLRTGPSKVKVIFSDVDGTLLNSAHKLAPATIAAIQDAVREGITFVMATGKARGPWVKELRKDLGLTTDGFTINGPGVFIQGLLVCDADSKPVQELLISNAAVRQVNEFCSKHEISVLAYGTGDRLLCTHTDSFTDIAYEYNEPPPEAIGREKMDLLGTERGEADVYKMLLIAEEPKLAALRAQLAEETRESMALTKAMDGMLELLPLGASKATGVAAAMKLMGVTPADCMAMGDGENDLEFLRLVREGGGVAVAMSNGVAVTKAEASAVVSSNDQDGAAEAIRRFALR